MKKRSSESACNAVFQALPILDALTESAFCIITRKIPHVPGDKRRTAAVRLTLRSNRRGSLCVASTHSG